MITTISGHYPDHPSDRRRLQMPQRLHCTAPKILSWVTYEEPELAADQVRVVAEQACAKHGTEMAFYKGYAFERGPWNNTFKLHEAAEGSMEDHYPFHIGNMYAGRVVARGAAVSELQIGDRVVGYGGFAETHTSRASDLLPLPEGMSWQAAMCFDPAQFALGAVRDGHIRPGDRVAVFSLGAIGLITAQCVKLAGAADIIAIDPIPRRRELAEQLTGCTSLDPTQGDVGKQLKELTGGMGPDVIIDFSGRREAIQAALRGIAFGGTVVLGAYPPPMDGGLDLGAEAHMNTPKLVFSRACSEPNPDHPRWGWKRINDTAWRFLAEGSISGDGIVEPVVPFDQLEQAYHEMAAHPERTVKLGTVYPGAAALIAEYAAETAGSR
ncbi:MAG: zinc-binding alcohol dehydrogenase [Planctomycetota bacterium]|jgi:threonine dehydrogenase-like Zn-dependent dehydrogenase|nr:zinc-binding alcohol dehydrogenase [Planctomycetota bacterium]